MDNPALASVREKVRWAKTQFEAIDAALKLTLRSKPEAESTNVVDAGREGQQLVANFRRVQPIEPSLPLMIGDCVHNLRSALDHLAFQLAVLNGASSSAAEKTMFPVCLAKSGKSGFDSRVEKSLKPFISSAALAAVEECQPYNAANGVPNQTAIWILHKLDIIDKHRLLLVARDEFAVRRFWFSADDLVNQLVVLPDLQWKPMEDGAEILRFQITGGPAKKTEVNVKIEAARSVQFLNTGLFCDGMPVASVLMQVGITVDAIVRDFGRDFFGE